MEGFDVSDSNPRLAARWSDVVGRRSWAKGRGREAQIGRVVTNQKSKIIKSRKTE